MDAKLFVPGNRLHINALLVLRGKAKPKGNLLEVIGECRRKLATDFDTPANEIIKFHAAKLGLDEERFNTCARRCG